jgi:hypothetical protein
MLKQVQHDGCGEKVVIPNLFRDLVPQAAGGSTSSSVTPALCRGPPFHVPFADTYAVPWMPGRARHDEVPRTPLAETPP